MKDFLKKIFGDKPAEPQRESLQGEEAPLAHFEAIVSQDQPEPLSPSVTSRHPKPDAVAQIEGIINRPLAPADEYPSDDLPGLRPYKENTPKYAVDEQQRLIGLNLVKTGLTDAQWQSICRITGALEHLRILNLSDNEGLTAFEFPPAPALRQLRILDLGDCQLKQFELPAGGLPCLEDLELEGNPLEEIGPETWAGGKAQVLAFLKAGARTGFVKSLEAKALLIGDGRSGKTTLRRRLLHGPEAPVVPTEERTKGLEVEVEPLWLSTAGGEKIRLNLFDFGGQNHYKPLHQFFYSHKALYILVTKNGDDTNDWNFWCETANLYGGGSPVIIINNLHDTEKSDFRGERVLKMEALVKEKYDCNLLRWYPKKQNAGPQDKERLQRELGIIREKLATTVQELEHIHSTVPANWQEVRGILEGMRGRNIIPKTELEAICRRPEIDAEPEACLEYLSTIGACLYYPHERKLKKHVIVNNDWAVEGVYRILDDQDVEARFGRFNEQDMERIWQPNRQDLHQDYHFEEYFDELNELMRRFKLYYDLKYKDENGYDRIAPSLLPKKQDSDPDWGASPDDLRLQVRYGFLPPALFSRFIVGMHRDIAGANRNHVWENEVWFEWENTEALAFLIEIENKKTIDIRVRGNDLEKRKILLSFLLRELDEPQNNPPGIDRVKMVPCICDSCKTLEEPHFYALKDLEEFKDLGIPTVRCNKFKINEVSVAALLGNVFIRSELYSTRSEICKEIKLHLDKSEVEEALYLLEKIDEDEAVMLRSRWVARNKQSIRGVLSVDELDNGENKIKSAILDWVKLHETQALR